MKIITQYIADDGTKFPTKDECLKYERKTFHFSSLEDVFLFDANGEEMKKRSFWIDMKNFFYIYVGSENSLEILKKINEEYNYILPEQEGFWKLERNEHGERILINYKKYINNIKQELNKYDDMDFDIQSHLYHLSTL